MKYFDPTLVRPGTVSFIRHGERASKDGDSPLTAQGKAEARRLGAMMDPTIILTSPKDRTVQTADGLSQGGVPILVLDSLRSNIYNDVEAYARLVEVHGKGLTRLMWKRGELPEEIIDRPEVRVRRILEDVIGSTSEDDAVIAVTHHFIIPLIPFVMRGENIGRVKFLKGITLERSDIVEWLDPGAHH